MSALESARNRVHEAKGKAADCKEAAAYAAVAIDNGDVARCLEDLARLKGWAERLSFAVSEAEDAAAVCWKDGPR